MQKNNLEFLQPFTNAAGTLGFTPDIKSIPNIFTGKRFEGLGAFITNPISLRPRQPAKELNLVHYPGGFLLHTGFPNPGFSSVIKKYFSKWADSRIPIIPHLLLDDSEEGQGMVRKLEDLENILSIEISFEPHMQEGEILHAVHHCMGEKPIIVQLDLGMVSMLGPKVIQAGAAAVSFAPLRGSILAESEADTNQSKSMVSGRLYGPGLFPQSLLVLHEALSQDLPVFAGVGVYSSEQADLMLSMGAIAVQFDTCFWK